MKHKTSTTKNQNPNSLFPIPASSEGFTLVEVLVSVFILSVALGAITFILTVNNNIGNLVRDNYIANNLVQEGMEVTRNIRDRDWFLGNAFGASLPNGTWQVQWDSTALSANSGSFLKIDGSGFYNYTSGTDTPFKRTVTISSGQSADEKAVVVTITWQERGVNKMLSAEDHLFNWK